MLNFVSIGLGVLEKQKGVFFSEQSAHCACRSASLFDWPMSFRWRHFGLAVTGSQRSRFSETSESTAAAVNLKRFRSLVCLRPLSRCRRETGRIGDFPPFCVSAMSSPPQADGAQTTAYSCNTQHL